MVEQGHAGIDGYLEAGCVQGRAAVAPLTPFAILHTCHSLAKGGALCCYEPTEVHSTGPWVGPMKLDLWGLGSGQ